MSDGGAEARAGAAAAARRVGAAAGAAAVRGRGGRKPLLRVVLWRVSVTARVLCFHACAGAELGALEPPEASALDGGCELMRRRMANKARSRKTRTNPERVGISLSRDQAIQLYTYSCTPIHGVPRHRNRLLRK